MIGKLKKIDEFEMNTAWGDIWRVIILGDVNTGGKAYAEAHIKKIGRVADLI